MEKQDIKQLLKTSGTLVITEDFNMCACELCSYAVKTVISNEELWEKWKSTVIGQTLPNYNLILL